MFRSYAVFSFNYPWVHRSFIAATFIFAIFCVYMTLGQDKYLFFPLLFLPLLLTLLFGKAADYRNKYLHGK